MSEQKLPFPPPPPVAGLGGGIGSLLLNRGPAQFQMKKVEKVEFSKQELPNNFVGKSPTIVMRNLDGYRTYAPLEGEKEQYNLPDERLIFSNAQHVMHICGGFAGMRFSSGDMIFISTITKRLNSSYDALDTHFRAMTNSSKKVAIPPEASAAAPAAVGEEDYAAVVRFNELALLHLGDVKDLHSFVVVKQEEFRKIREEAGEEKVIISKDPDGLSGSSKPRWLELLLQCYKQHVLATCSTPEKPPPLTVGKFCRYLSKVVVTDIIRATPIQGEVRRPQQAASTSPSTSSNARPRSGSGGNSGHSSGTSSPTAFVGQGEGSAIARCGSGSPGVDLLLWGDEERQAMMELIAASNDHTSLFGVTATATAPPPGSDQAASAAAERAEDAAAAAHGGSGHGHGQKAGAPHGSGLLTSQKIASGSFDDSDGENTGDGSQSPLSPRPPAKVQGSVHAPLATTAAAATDQTQSASNVNNITSRPYASPPCTAAARRHSPKGLTSGHGGQFFGQGHHHGSTALHSQHYYAKRFFDFVSTLSEMKSVPKDEKSLFA